MHRLHGVFGAILMLLGSLSGQAQRTVATATNVAVPPLVNFNGVLIDVNGKPLTGVVGVTFSLYKEQQGSAPLWMETQNVQPDAKGHYSVMLGATTTTGLPTSLFGTGEAHWLGVQVQGREELPRALLLSVPYALKALDAETIGGKPASSFMLAPATGTSGNPAPPASNITGSGTADFIPRFTGTTTIGNSNIFESVGGNVGIATTTPASKFDVKGTGDFRDTLTLFPKLTHPTLSVHGTAFGVSNTGQVTFVPGQTFPGAGTVTSVGSGAGLTGGPITTTGTLSIATGGVTNAMLAHSSLTVTAGTDLTGGGSVALGGSTTLNLDTTKVPQLVANNAFTGNQTINGNLGVGTLNATSVEIGTTTTKGMLNAAGSSTLFIGADVVGSNAPSGSGMSGTDGIQATGGNSDTSGQAGTGGTGVAGTGGFGGEFGGAGGAFIGGSSNFAFDGDGIDATTVDGVVNGNLAANFTGNINVSGTITAGGKDFKIDHPGDPANKYLIHASVESAEMMNIYTGNVVLNSSGETTVNLPGWFEEVNSNFRYQLTCIGGFAPVYISQKIEDHLFRIAGGRAGLEVSWQVTAVRHDPYAKANPLVVEQEKEPRLRGFYIHPELYGAPPEKQIEWARHPQMMKRIQEIRANGRH